MQLSTLLPSYVYVPATKHPLTTDRIDQSTHYMPAKLMVSKLREQAIVQVTSNSYHDHHDRQERLQEELLLGLEFS